MTTIYVAYASEDEGFRYPIFNPTTSLDKIKQWARDYIQRLRYQVYKTADDVPELNFSSEQIENTAPPNCHGEVVVMYSLDGYSVADSTHWANDSDVAYAHDWLFIIEMNAED